MGRHTLLRAWQAVLEGRESDVPPFAGYDVNVLAKLGEAASESSVLAPKQLSAAGMMRFIFNFVWEKYWYPLEEGRIINLPPAYFSALKKQALADLASLDPSLVTYKTGTKEPFLTDGDILTAWTFRLLARSNTDIATSPASRTVGVMNVLGMRDILRNTSPPLLDKNAAYIHNCVTTAWSHFSVREFLSLPLGHVAARIRADLVLQSSREQLEASQKLAATTSFPLFGSGNMVMFTMTNWVKAGLFQTDFSGAKVGGKGSGKPIYIHPYAHTRKFMTRRCANVCGRDATGGYWVGALTRSEYLGNMKREVERLVSGEGEA
jgi:hypothetical protein